MNARTIDLERIERPLPRFVAPGDVRAIKARVEPITGALDRIVASRSDLSPCTRSGWSAFSAALHRFAMTPESWLDASSQMAHAEAYERQLARWRRAIQTEVTRAPVVGVDPGISITWPSRVIDYRRLWDPYVTGTARAAAACAELPPPPSSKLTPELWHQGFQEDADSIMTAWNIHAGAPASEIMLFAGRFLQDFQHTVKRVGNYYQPRLREHCPSVPLPEPPPFEIQNPIVSAIEDAEILAKGIIEILGVAADGTLEAMVSAGKFVERKVDKALNVAPVVAGAALVIGLVVLVKR